MQDLLIPKDLPSLEEIKKQISGYPKIDALAIFTLNELRRTSKAIEQELDKDLSTHNLSLGRHVALWCVAVLAHNEGISPAEIADQIGVTRATITGLLDSLEDGKLIVRKRRTDDKRKVSVFLTKKGREKIERVYPAHYENITEAFSVFDDKEKLLVVKLLRRLREASDKRAKIAASNSEK